MGVGDELMSDPSFYTKREAAEAMRISPKVLTGLMRRRLIPYIKLGHRTVIFRKSMIEKAMIEMERRAIWA